MKLSLLRVAAILLIFAVPAFGQLAGSGLQNLNLDFAGGGARAEGMGKAYIGLSDGVTGGSWNPAGMYMHDTPMLGISYGMLVPRGKTSTTFFSNFTSQDHTGTFNKITSLNFLAPIRIKGHKFVGSFNYTRNYDEFTTQANKVTSVLPAFIPVPNFGITLLNEDTLNYSTSNNYTEMQGGLYTINLGFGTRLYKKISFGVSANIYTGRIVEIVSAVDSLDDVQTPDITFNQNALYVFGGRVLDSIGFTGVNFNIGLKYNGDKLTAGLLMRTPLSLGAKNELTSTQTLYVNGNLIADRSGTVLSPKINPPLTKYEMPMMLAAGFGYKVSENLLVALDVEYRGFSNSTVKVRDSLIISSTGDNVEFYTDFDPDTLASMQWKNAFVVRVGGEYMFSTGFGQIPLRGGFGYVPVPASAIELNNGTSSQANLNFSVGSGIHWEQIYLDLSYTYTLRDDTFYDAFYQELVFIDREYRNHTINMSFTGYF
jgi:long-subunit fatty acid transport protein